MRRRFRRRRFRRRSGGQRPSWRLLADFNSGMIIGGGAPQPFPYNTAILTTPIGEVVNQRNDPGFLGGADSFFNFPILNQTTGAGEAAFPLIDDTELDFFEGELTVIRLMGFLRLRAVTVDDIANRNQQLCVRALIYKTWQQTEGVSERVGVMSPFNFRSMQGRLLWMAQWNTLLQQLPGNPTDAQMRALQEQNLGSGTETTSANGEFWRDRVRSISIRQAIKIKGNERIALSFWAGPMPNGNAQTHTIIYNGYIRALIKH